MASRMTWDRLFSETRQRSGTATTETRNQFEADYDRIVGSSSVRRLQDKAQVFPLQENDYTRTRLTHSIEVSALARSLGKAVGQAIVKANVESRFGYEEADKLASLLQVTGLIHDLGNPPFGHYGETVIQNWFKNWFNSEYKEFEKVKANLKEKALLTEQEKNDFIHFDGNVQNLRIVTKLQTLNDAKGANFTYATLATIIKYPWKSNDNRIRTGQKKKFGYFASEEHIIKAVFQETGLQEGIRHPATYLLEAADDIIYLCDDIEDGVKKGYINWNKEYHLLKSCILKDASLTDTAKINYTNLFERIDAKTPDTNMDENEKILAQVRNFRNLTQGYLFEVAKENFMKHYDQLLCGTFEEKEILYSENILIDALKKLTQENCFVCNEVLSLELVGAKVINTLLDIFVPTILNSSEEELQNTRTYAGKLYRLISPNFKYIACYNYETDQPKKISELSVYDKLHLVVDYISGMTDSFAVNLYKKLSGIELPN